MKGTGAKRNVCPGSCVNTGAKFPVAPVESAPMCIALVLRLGHATGSVYWYGHAEVCGSGLLRHSLNFSTAWCTMRLSVSTRLEACINAEGGYSEHLLWVYDVACLTFQLPHITTGSFPSHRRQSTTGSLQSSDVWKNATNFQSDEKVLHFTS